jgi:hypothetical protein
MFQKESTTEYSFQNDFLTMIQSNNLDWRRSPAPPRQLRMSGRAG